MAVAPEQPETEEKNPFKQGLRFVIKKFLQRMKVLEKEEKIVEREAEQLATNTQKKKVKNIIDTL